MLIDKDYFKVKNQEDFTKNKNQVYLLMTTYTYSK